MPSMPMNCGSRGGIGAEPHQRQRDRVAGLAHQLGQELGGPGAGIDDAAADVEDRPLGPGHQVDRLLDPALSGSRAGW